eukprot:tig00001388_g8580.t1
MSLAPPADSDASRASPAFERSYEQKKKINDAAVKANSTTGSADVTAEEKKLLAEMEGAESSKERGQAGGMRYMSDVELAEQRKVCFEFVRNLGYQFLSGGDVANTSLPVRLFEPRSFLERMTEFWTYHDLLKKALAEKDPVERMKYTVAFAIAGLHRDIKDPKKPFNPILGETFQAGWPDGSEVYCEQTSHHPPVSHFDVRGPGSAPYHLHGFMQLGAAVRGNYVRVTHVGEHHATFPDGTTIRWDMPAFRLDGIFYGERIANVQGTMHFVDERNKLLAVVKFNPDEPGWFMSFFRSAKTPSDYFVARIYRLDLDEGDAAPAPEQAPDEGDEVLAEGDGSWLDKVKFGDKVYWDMQKDQPIKAVPVKNPLPSDVSFRSDLTALAKGDYEAAQVNKCTLEEQQRDERKLRKLGKEGYLAKQARSA